MTVSGVQAGSALLPPQALTACPATQTLVQFVVLALECTCPKCVQQSGCSRTSVSGVPYCPDQHPSASKQSQYPSFVWTSTTYSNSVCSGSAAYYTYGLNGTSMKLGTFCATTYSSTNSLPGYTTFGSVRCRFGFRMKLLVIGGCSSTSVSGIPYCPAQRVDAGKKECYSSLLWSSTSYSDTNCSGGTGYRSRGLSGSSLASGGFCATTIVSTYAPAPGYTYFGSVRILVLECLR